ncbi:hypothetical protein CH373_04905 [Leptospira perolatii]|uniref:HAMP domain-containing protein n=1 Tax=Leptospira perolatii TaxID=2023191 RepID=A0A2M9ZQA1_9LEPT|nr:SpoIIE family protein phosphatase [Leptospira perolatii]PJZ70416.1 hypothetical protein CH360_05325 [Leptospira perolatii]PJZ74252.1 hypothetical protein CH373_04905 [Leptospira perolatii]
MKSVLRKLKKPKSLRIQIGLLYVLLAIVNIIFFSVMIFENQMDLLIKNFQYNAESLVNAVSHQLEKSSLSKEKNEDYKNLIAILISNGVNSFIIADEKGDIWHKENLNDSPPLTLPSNFTDKIKEVNSRSSFLNTKYLVELDNKNFLVRLLIPLKAISGNNPYLYSVLSIKMILDRLRLLYFQIGLSIAWGVVFHFIFAIYLFRAIFKRLQFLETASIQMASGNLKARAAWKRSREDELDQLGNTFNMMADRIEDSMTKIVKLNSEIQRELQVGKQVQTLFLPDSSAIKEFNPAIFYLPMREVSGDIYNFFNINSDLKAIFLGDAVGHGVSAALVTSVIQMSLNSALEETHNPGKVINKLCFDMFTILQSAFLASGVFFLFDKKGKAYFANAAHNPPIYIRNRNRKMIRMESSGTLLGLTEESITSIRAIDTCPGDKLLLYTDGLVESMNHERKMFGIDRVEKILFDNFHLSNQDISNRLNMELMEHASEFRDDVTFILLEIPPNES